MPWQGRHRAPRGALPTRSHKAPDPQQTLPARWRRTLAALESARCEYRRLRAAQATDVRALRKAAQRIHDLEQLRAVLSRELIVRG